MLTSLYKRVLPSLGGYITDTGCTYSHQHDTQRTSLSLSTAFLLAAVDMSRADVLLAEVGAVEDVIFQRRHRKLERDKAYYARQVTHHTMPHQAPTQTLTHYTPNRSATLRWPRHGGGRWHRGRRAAWQGWRCADLATRVGTTRWCAQVRHPLAMAALAVARPPPTRRLLRR